MSKAEVVQAFKPEVVQAFRPAVAEAVQAFRPAVGAAAKQITLSGLRGLPLVKPGDDLAGLLAGALRDSGIVPVHNDILVVAQKIVSKAEGRFVDLADIVPGADAMELAAEVGKDPRLVEVILAQSSEVVRHRKDVLIVAHRLGFVMANAGVDQSNVGPEGSEQVLLLPEIPTARRARSKRGSRTSSASSSASSSTTASDGRGDRASWAWPWAPRAFPPFETSSAHRIRSAGRCASLRLPRRTRSRRRRPW